LAVYGINYLVLAVLYVAKRRTTPTPPEIGEPDWPPVTVQVPVYNERHVIERVVDAVASLDYPLHRLEIQVLDDSDDSTTRLAERRAAHYRSRGVDVKVVRRPDRTGYKAGALMHGLKSAGGEFIALFDADFCPRPAFLRETIPHFLDRPRLGMVQGRWSYLNRDHSRLTRAQALALDGHFVVEQSARSCSELLMSFNGSAGVWRRHCIEESGGWTADTLCEDLDLSYRAQLAGWECLYLDDVEAAAELPPQIAAFKLQQSRWSQGSIQCLRKLAGPLVRSRSLNWRQKAMALVHLSGYSAHPLTLALLVVSLPLLLVPASAQLPLGALGLVYLGPPLVYAISQKRLYADWGEHLLAFPFLALLGIGIAWNNAKAVCRALTRWGGSFARTPKFRLDEQGGDWHSSTYRLRVDSSTIGEVALAAYALATAGFAVVIGRYQVLPFVLLYAASFGMVATTELAQALGARAPRSGGRRRRVRR
jgi:cellulose synthase/poly-beta-1,6-N-acetylglucosamine synthase-like glycosyltransferase